MQLGTKHLKKALEINPNDSDALLYLGGGYALYGGKTSAAYPLVERYKRVDPLNRLSHLLGSMLFFNEGKYELALKEMRKFYLKEPYNPMVQNWYARTLIYNECFDDAFAIVNRSYKTIFYYVWPVRSGN